METTRIVEHILSVMLAYPYIPYPLAARRSAPDLLAYLLAVNSPLLEHLLPTVLTTLLESFPEGTGNPEQRMDAEEAESSDQQSGHRPESIEEIGVFFLVMMGCVGQVAGELAV